MATTRTPFVGPAGVTETTPADGGRHEPARPGDLLVAWIDDELARRAIDDAGRCRGQVVDRGPEAQHERDPEGARHDRGVPGRGAAGQGDAGDQLRPEGRHGRRIQVHRDHDGRHPVGVPEVRPVLVTQDRGDSPADIADIGGALAEVGVIDGGQDRGLLIGRPQDRGVGSGPARR